MPLDLPNPLEEENTPEEGAHAVPEPRSRQGRNNDAVHDIVTVVGAVVPNERAEQRREHEGLHVTAIRLKEPGECVEADALRDDDHPLADKMTTKLASTSTRKDRTKRAPS